MFHGEGLVKHAHSGGSLEISGLWESALRIFVLLRATKKALWKKCAPGGFAHKPPKSYISSHGTDVRRLFANYMRKLEFYDLSVVIKILFVTPSITVGDW